MTTEQGLPAELLTMEFGDGWVTAVRFVVFYERIAFNATYVIRGEEFESNLALVQYSFGSFHVTDLE